MHASELLASIEESEQLFDYSEINMAAIRAQDLSQDAINQVHTCTYMHVYLQ